ncbi:response regulator [Halotalea alkalilenta]|uniref:Transcriptional regulatory protein n=1 Tax=Halotalea alkalilenta TaxID=376489 RepID=A0A172YD84_9GAMM|nr:response regulator [Halotalea alkalilenta]ANF57221.1 two-component system response regulator [Halotalea alkalilenta]
MFASQPAQVMIVEDDPMVMKLNVEYLARIEGAVLAAQAVDVASAQRLLEENEEIDIVLLDVYLGGQSGLILARWLSQRQRDVDVILITAASEAEAVRTARRLRVSDYLVKPFEFERFRQALNDCIRQRAVLARVDDQVDQRTLDGLFRLQPNGGGRHDDLPKGLTSHSLAQVAEAVLLFADDPFTTEALAEGTGMSRVSVRKYLKYLIELQAISESFAYGQIGRPSFTYQSLDRRLLERCAGR